MNSLSKLEAIFFAALENRPGQDRATFLDKACSGDDDLRQRVEKMLVAQGSPDSFLESPPSGFDVDPVPTLDQPTQQIGTMLGPYKLLEQIGEGGMGVVYMAQQTQPVKRKVAVKVIKPGMDSKQVIAHFEAERQALAMMDHPHIARVLDAGTTDSSRPYFVMELVRGVPITEYCNKQRLNARGRLKLFLDVCHAVQHAHLKGIIHRDLKPSNVLVTLHDGTPVVKVIDFGVAKALNQELTEKTLFTQFSQMVGTPLYMSPEQAELSGLDIDTRTDVYSLGVLLYELLTGTTPFDKDRLKNAGFDEMRRIIREDEPPRPSTRISTLRAAGESTAAGTRGSDPRQLSRLLRDEIDWIVMKALEKDRSRRYESASALATDIQRYLSDEPVLACPPTTMYRFQKFARKHKPAIATAAAIALCLLLGTSVSAWQAVRATTAEAQANANEQKAVANEQKANSNAAAAQEKEQEAVKQRDEVKSLNEKLLATQQELRSTLYAAHMNLAHNAWGTGGVGHVLGLLEQHRPKGAESDRRGFEWHFLDRLCHADLLTLKGHTRDVMSVAFSPDGKRLVSAAGDDTLKLWDAETGQETLTIKKAGGWMRSVAFSPDGKQLANLTNDRKVKIWDAQTGQELLSIDGATAGLSSTVVFSPDGKRLANDGKVWDAQTGQVLLTLTVGRRDYIGSVAFSPDGKRMASAGNRVKVWDAETGQELRAIEHLADGVLFSPDGKRLASSFRNWGREGDRGDVKVWDSETGQELLTLKGATRHGVSSLAYSPDGRRLAGGSWDNTVKVWDAQTGQQLSTLKGHTGVIDSVAYSPDGQRLASASRDKTVKVWQAQELTSQEALTLRGGTNRAWDVAFSPDGKRLVSASMHRSEVVVWDAQTGQDLQNLKGHTERVWSVAYSPDGKRLASASRDKAVKVWDAQTGKELLALDGHTDVVLRVVFSPDGQRLASTSFDNTLKLWNAQTGELILTLTGLPKHTVRGYTPTRGIAFSPDGKRLASGCNTEVKVWDTQTGQELLTLKNPPLEFISVAFSPDGKRLAMSSVNGTVKVCDSQTGQDILTLTGHNSPVASVVASVVFSPDGRRLASGSHDGTVKVWNAQTGQDTLTLTGHTHYVCNVAFSPDGNRLASNDSDGVVKIWDATPLPEKP